MTDIMQSIYVTAAAAVVENRCLCLFPFHVGSALFTTGVGGGVVTVVTCEGGGVTLSCGVNCLACRH